MKVLFLVFHGFSPHNGISKKIFSQIRAFRSCGCNVELCYMSIDENGNQKRMIDNEVLEDYGSGFFAKINKWIRYRLLTDYILREKVELVYMRSSHDANPFLIKMLRKLRNNNVKIVMEIPTYPYDGEFKHSILKHRIRFYLNCIYRKKLCATLDRIVTFSNYDRIEGVKTVKLSNGIDFEQIKIREQSKRIVGELHLIGVAEIHFWHGYDRLIQGLSEYYKKQQNTKVFFHIVGTGAFHEVDKLVRLTQENNLGDYVIFHGSAYGEDLDRLFSVSDIGVASLGRHRSNISHIKTLKNREYAARGIPFIYSEIDEDFEEMPYVLKISADEIPVDIEAVLNFYTSQTWSSQAIRSSVNNLSWEEQIKKLLRQINSIA